MATNTYTAIATQTLASAASSVTFSSIPSGYTDLVIVCNFGQSVATANTRLRFNGDTGNNYSYTNLRGNGSSAASSREVNISYIGLDYFGLTSNLTNISKINIQNYSNATTYKSVLLRTDTADYGTAAIVGTWRNTAAITSIEISSIAYQFIAGSTFSLYGIAAAGAPTAKATGGTITYDVGYTYHTFLSSGTFTPSQSLTCDVLMVAGGGGAGGDFAGGGGAGGLLYSTGVGVTATGYAVTVGAGGAGTVSTQAGNGSSSTFSTLTAVGGGSGGSSSNSIAARSGGSGGGGSRGGTGAAGTSGQGFAGGNSVNNTQGAGGGGAGAAAPNSTTDNQGSPGGAGSATYSSWATVTSSGASGYYAGGGGGAGYYGVGGNGGAGGAGGGGVGGGQNTSGPGGNGTTNTGGGGGGGSYYGGMGAFTGGSGGSGIVIIRYPN